MLAVLFPGQGSQYVGMGSDLYQKYDVLLSPTSPCTAFKLGEKVNDPMTMYVNDICTIPSNLIYHIYISISLILSLNIIINIIINMIIKYCHSYYH